MRNDYKDPKWIGQRFNSFTVMDYEVREHLSGSRSVYWIAQCDCGNVKSVAPLKLITGHTKTCGCGKIERCHRLTEKYRTIHGGRHDRLYQIWHGMKQRCLYSHSKDFANYGGRGVALCEEWANDYAKFRKWALGNGYADNLTIDRIDVNGTYEPNNCRWITAKEQSTNRRNSHLYEYDGEILGLPEIAKRLGVKYQTLYKWAVREGLSINDAIAKCPRS